MARKQRTAGAARSACLRTEGRKTGINIGLIAITGDDAPLAGFDDLLRTGEPSPMDFPG